MAIGQENILEFVENEARLVAPVTRLDTQFSKNDNQWGKRSDPVSAIRKANTGLSIGIATVQEHGTDISPLIKQAHAAMYSMKRNEKIVLMFISR